MNRLIHKVADKLHYKTKFQGLDIHVENRKGSYRRGTDPDGNEWATKMTRPYGYIKGYKGVDDDELDVFIGTHKDSNFVLIVHLKDVNTGKYDEDKVFLGFENEREAMSCFKKSYDDWKKFFQGSTKMHMDEFRGKLWANRKKPKKIAMVRYQLMRRR